MFCHWNADSLALCSDSKGIRGGTSKLVKGAPPEAESYVGAIEYMGAVHGSSQRLPCQQYQAMGAKGKQIVSAGPTTGDGL